MKHNVTFWQNSANIAVVFRGELPKTYKGIEVVNGDETDLRFLDGKNKIVGLIEKGLQERRNWFCCGLIVFQ